MLTRYQHFSYACGVLKATVVIILSAILGFGALMAIRAESRSRVVRASVAGLAFVLLAIVLRPEKDR
jgi:uncharacterized membrane protein